MKLDHLGIGLSSLCIIHCILLPIIIVAFPTLGLEFTENETLHKIIIIFIVLVGACAFIPGVSLHKRKRVIMSAGIGITLVLLGTLHVLGHDHGHSSETLFTGIGSVLLIYAHITNHTFCKHCKEGPHCCEKPEK